MTNHDKTDAIASAGTPLDYTAFIRANTHPAAPPLVPEITLHLTDDTVPLWQKAEEQLNQMNVPPPFWAFAWAGGQALARYVLDNAAVVTGRSVIDLGAGCGLSAIAANLAGARDVLAADVDPLSCHAIVLNATANGAALRTTTENLLAAPPPPADVLLIGDLFYEKDLSDDVITWAAKLASNGATVFVGDPNRTFFPGNRFDKIAEYSVPVIPALEDTEFKTTAVWRLKSV